MTETIRTVRCDVQFEYRSTLCHGFDCIHRQADVREAGGELLWIFLDIDEFF